MGDPKERVDELTLPMAPPFASQAQFPGGAPPGLRPSPKTVSVGQDCILPADFQSAEAPVANRRAA
jgi:hypothetical protein